MSDDNVTQFPKTHNRPPPFDQAVVDELDKDIVEFGEAAGEWSKSVTDGVKDKSQAEKLRDFLAGASKLAKRIEEARVTEKAPHLEAGRQVDTVFQRLAHRVEKMADLLKPALQKWVKDEQRRLDEERAEAQRKADEAAREAERLRANAEARNDVIGQADADDAAKEAERLAKEASRERRAKVSSATGGARAASIRKRRVAVIANVGLAFTHYRERPEVAECLRQLAQRDVTAAKGAKVEIPGVKIEIEESVA